LTTGKIYDRKGPQYVIFPATLLLAASLWAILAAHSAPLLFLAALGYGAAAGSLFPALQSLTISSVERPRHTMATATFYVFYDIGFGIGVAFLGYLSGRSGGYAAAFDGALLFTGLLFAGYLTLYILTSRREAAEAAPGKVTAAAPAAPANVPAAAPGGAPCKTASGHPAADRGVPRPRAGADTAAAADLPDSPAPADSPGPPDGPASPDAP
jgi:MFS family permease